MPEADTNENAVELRRGRTLTVAPEGDEDLIEIRSSSGLVELRIKLTEQGPVLELELVRLSLRAAEAIDISAKELTINAEQSLGLSSQGDITVSGKADVNVDAEGEVHVKGEMIHLN